MRKRKAGYLLPWAKALAQVLEKEGVAKRNRKAG
jgi:hypothetical protein